MKEFYDRCLTSKTHANLLGPCLCSFLTCLTLMVELRLWLNYQLKPVFLAYRLTSLNEMIGLFCLAIGLLNTGILVCAAASLPVFLPQHSSLIRLTAYHEVPPVSSNYLLMKRWCIPKSRHSSRCTHPAAY